MIYQNSNIYYPYTIPFNSSYAFQPVMTNSQFTIPHNTNQYFPLSMTQQQPSLVPENAPNVSVPTYSYTMPFIQQQITPNGQSEISSNGGQPETSSND